MVKKYKIILYSVRIKHRRGSPCMLLLILCLPPIFVLFLETLVSSTQFCHFFFYCHIQGEILHPLPRIFLKIPNGAIFFIEHILHASTGEKRPKNLVKVAILIFLHFSARVYSLIFPVESISYKDNNMFSLCYKAILLSLGLSNLRHKLGIEREKFRLFYFSNHH